MKTHKPFGTNPRTSLALTLIDHNTALAQEWAKTFSDVAAVEIVEGNLLDLRCDALVSPANSFGDMGGGLDKSIDDFHHGEAQRRTMAAIAEHFLGELPVGAALIIELPSARFSFLIVAPTMRVPANIMGTINAYLAMRAILVAVVRHNTIAQRPIRSVAIPGLGTGVGGLPYTEAAAQMRTAYDNVIGEGWRQIVSPIQAPYALRGNR